MKTNETYLPLKRPSAGPFFKSTLAEIYFTIYTYLSKTAQGAQKCPNLCGYPPVYPLRRTKTVLFVRLKGKDE
ncbi:MAG: hypothetical protein II824_08110 [Bacteroidales bacterium]|nr:hypothetical protein [Bacteroidales bacterium]